MTRANVKVRLVLSKSYLVPYRSIHVNKYAEWMQDEDLREQTGSELLSLEEEFKNQQSWRDDPSKCTFIVLDKASSKMIGDVNVFLSESPQGKQAEINVMIAEPSFRRKGMATEAVLGMMWFAQQKLEATRFIAKVSLDNGPSLGLFKNHLYFEEESKSEAFQEVTLVATPRTLELLVPDLAVEEPFVDAKIESIRKSGNEAFANQNFPRAVTLYDMAITLDSKDEVLRGNRSAARLRAGELFGALSDAVVCMELANNYVKGCHRLGNAWAALGYEDKAKQVYRMATEQFPEHQQAFQDIASRVAQQSIVQRQGVSLSPINNSTFKLAERAVEIEKVIELETEDARGARFGCIVYIWEKLSGQERMGIYEECARAGYLGTAPIIPTAEQLAEAKTPPFKEAIKASDLPVQFIRYVEGLGRNDPLEMVAALVLLFEGCMVDDRDLVAGVLLAVVQQSEGN